MDTQVLLAEVVSAMKKVRPDVINEFNEQLEMLAFSNPLPESTRQILKEIIG